MPHLLRFRLSLTLLVLGASSCERRGVNVPAAPAAASSQPAARPAAHSKAAAPANSTPKAASSPAAKSESVTESQDANRYQLNKPPRAAKKTARSKKPAPNPAAPADTPAAPADTPAAPAATPAAPAATPAAPAPAAADPPTPAPKLGDVLTAEEQRQFNTSIDQSLAHAQASLDHIRGHRLTAPQADEVEQIGSFIKQAQAARAADLAGAKSLAERAEVLAKDLAAAFR